MLLVAICIFNLASIFLICFFNYGFIIPKCVSLFQFTQCINVLHMNQHIYVMEILGIKYLFILS